MSIKVIDRYEGIFRVDGKQVYYLDLTDMLYPNSFIKNVINSMNDVFVYFNPKSDDGGGCYSKPEDDDVVETDLIEFIENHKNNWRHLQDE